MKGTLDKRVISFIALLASLLTATVCFAEDSGTMNVYGGMLVPIAADVEKLDPFYGGGLAFQEGNMRLAFDYFKGDGESASYGYATVDVDDTLMGLTLDYLFTPTSETSGSYWGAGIGYFKETVEVSAAAYGYNYESDIEASTFSLEMILGYQSGGFELFGRLVSFPSSENTTVAAIFGVGLAF